MTKKKDLFCVYKRNFLPDNLFKTILYLILSIIFIAFLLTLIHESGHLIMGLILGWNVHYFQITPFPFIFSFNSAFVLLSPRHSPSSLEIVLIYSAGSLHSLIWSYVFFYLWYKYKLPRFFEIAFLIYSLTLFLDCLTYIFLDLLFLKCGDWTMVYKYCPILIILLTIFSLINLFLFILYNKKIIKRIDLL